VKIILADYQKKVVEAWEAEFAGVSDIDVKYGSVFDVESDALVSPANSFGFMDGGLDKSISKFLGWHIQKRLQEIIRDKHHGELLVGEAEIIPTDSPTIPYIISAPTMRVPMLLEDTVNVYLATRAVLLLHKYGVFEDGLKIAEKIKTIVFPGMGTGVGMVQPVICARQMKRAVDEVFLNKYTFPKTWKEAEIRHRELFSYTREDLSKF